MIIMSIYGIPDPTPEEIEKRQNMVYNYLKALIDAENLNPETDWDGVIETRLLKKIAIADLNQDQRTELTILLVGNENEEED